MLLQKLIASLVLVFLAGPAFATALPQDADAAAAKKSSAKTEPATDEESVDEPAVPAGPVLVLTNARIVTLDNAGVIDSGSIVIVGGKITAVGKSVEIPEGAKQIDCAGRTVTPGLIDARSRLWLDAGSASQSGGSASLDICDGIDPYGEDWIDVVRAGVTAVYLQPAGNDICAGVGAVVATAPANNAGQSKTDSLTILKHDAGLQAALGVGTSTTGRARAQQFDRLKKLFADAKKYQDDWKTWNDYLTKKKAEEEKAKASETDGEAKEGETKPADAGKPGQTSDENARPARPGPPDGTGGERPTGGRRGFGGRRGETPPATPAADGNEKPAVSADEKDKTDGDGETKEEQKPPTEPKPDPIKDRLVKVLTGEIPVFITVNNPDDATRALELAKEFSLRLILDGLVDSGSAATELRASRFPMVLGPWISGNDANADLQEFWREQLCEWDGRIAIGTFGGSPRSSCGLRAHAALAVAAGCDAERALSAITIDAARILGVAEQTGSIAVGKRADLAVFDGDPLDTSNAVRITVVGGEVVFASENSDGKSNSENEIVESISLPSKLPARFSLTSENVLSNDGSFEKQTLTIENGKVVSSKTGDTPHFDLGRTFVTPGLFVANSGVGLSAEDFKGNESDARHLGAADGFNPTDRAVSKLARSGVLQAMLVPPGQNTLAGRVAMVRLGANDSIANADVGDKFVMSGSARNREKFPSSLGGQREMIESLFYGTPATTRMYLPDATMQLLVESRAAGTSGLLSGKRLAVFEAATDAEVRTTLDLIETHKLRAAIVGVENVGRFIDRLIATKTTLIAGPFSDTDQPWRMEDLIAATSAGVPVLWTGESGLQLRRSVAIAVAAGLDPAVAMKSMTGGQFRDAAPIADFVIWSGVPTDLRARPLAVIVDGQRVSDSDEE